MGFDTNKFTVKLKSAVILTSMFSIIHYSFTGYEN